MKFKVGDKVLTTEYCCKWDIPCNTVYTIETATGITYTLEGIDFLLFVEEWLIPAEFTQSPLWKKLEGIHDTED